MPPLAEAQSTLRKHKKYNTATDDFQYGGWNSFTLQSGTWLWGHDIEFTEWQHPAMRHVALGRIRPNVRHIEILLLISILTSVILLQSAGHPCVPRRVSTRLWQRPQGGGNLKD